MRVAIVHYHLKPGGVTRVIENTIRALNEKGIESMVFCSEKPLQTAYPFDNVRIIPELAYKDTFSRSAAEALKNALESACRKEWQSLPDIWHVHNHSLAKNLELPVVVSQWAREKQKLLLQIHDFAEDGRPENYKALLLKLAGKDIEKLNEILYPTGDHIGYAFINGRDRRFFQRAGVDQNQCHLLTNPVWLDVGPDAILNDTLLRDKKLYLYPTRSIRRKNLGELLLWSAAADEDEVFGSTMAPANPTALPIYKRWVEFAKQLRLPMLFDLGTKHSFSALLYSAYALATTSIAEGFGLAYLEPYLIDAQLVGRDLPEITQDFAEYGIHLEGLYPRLDIPLAWVGKDRLRKTVHDGLVRYYQTYRQVFHKSMTDDAYEDMTQGDLVDFGRLDESMQESVIELICKNKTLKLDFAPEKLDRLLPSETIKTNRNAIEMHFNPQTYGRTLVGIYESIVESTPTHPGFLDTTKVLQAFMDPRRFNLLRT
jgi:hypothetical protein